MAAKTTKTKKDFVYAPGKRRTASARARLFRGKGESTVNNLPIAEYFPGIVNENYWARPFRILDVASKYYVTVRVIGGGKKGQLGAVAHAVAKALAKEKEEYRKPLKDAGLLTRDARIRERRKVGTGGRARRQKQSPKR